MKFLFSSLFLFLPLMISAQTADNYQFSITNSWAKGGGDASFEMHGLQARLLSMNFGENKKGNFSIAGSYHFIDIDFKQNNELFGDLNHFHSAGLRFTFTKPLKNPRWYFLGTVAPQLSSNFKGSLSSDDLYLTGAAMMIYALKRNERLIFGLAYTNTLGFPAPIPMVSYWKAWNDKWELNLGFPKLFVNHHFNKKSSLMGLVELAGYNGNISEPMKSPLFAGDRIAQRISYLDIQEGLEYHYKLKDFQFVLHASYTVNRNFKLQNTDKETAYPFHMDNGFKIGAGIDFNL